MIDNIQKGKRFNIIITTFGEEEKPCIKKKDA